MSFATVPTFVDVSTWPTLEGKSLTIGPSLAAEPTVPTLLDDASLVLFSNLLDVMRGPVLSSWSIYYN